MNERKLRSILLNNLQEFNVGKLIIGEEVPVPYKHIYLPNTAPDATPELELWCFKQDIAIYEKLYDRSIGYKDAKITATSNTSIQIRLEKDNAQNTNDVGLPHVIIEIKRKQPNTHEILAYSQKIQMIKTIFPYCRFIFLIFGKISPRTYRLGLYYFDKIETITHINNIKEINRFKVMIKQLLKEVQEDVIKLNSGT